MMRNSLWLVATLVAVVSTQDCYFPDGTKTSTTKYKYEPCGGVNTTWNTCCVFQEGDICQPNGLCAWPGNYDYRAGCTDKDWKGCLNMCPGDKENAWVQVRRCAGDEYCCDPDNRVNCCDGDNKSARFTLNNTGPTGDKPVTQVPVRPSAYTVTVAAPAASSAEAEADKSKAEGSNSGDGNSTTNASNNANSNTNNAGAIAGGVVGGVVGLALVAVLAFFLFRKKRQPPAQADDEAAAKSSPSTTTATTAAATTPTPPPAATSPSAESQSAVTKTDTVVTSPSSEVDAGPGSVLAESDSRPFVAYEMPATRFSHHER